MNSIITPGAAGNKINEDGELEAMDVTGSDSISEIPDTGVIADPNDFAHADQNWITPEEIERSYKSQKKAPSSLKAFFGPVTIKELQDVLNDNHILEIESLVAKKELTLHEAVEYATTIPELQMVRRRIDALAKKVVATMVAQKKIRSALNSSLSSRRVNPAPFRPGYALGVEIFKKIDDDLGNFFCTGRNKSIKNAQVHYLIEKLNEYIVKALHKELTSGDYGATDREEINAYLGSIYRTHMNHGAPFVPALYFNLIEIFEDVTRRSERSLYFRDMISALGAVSAVKDMDDAALEAANKKLRDETAEFLEIDKPRSMVQTVGASKIQLEAKSYEKVTVLMEYNSCVVRIFLGPGAKYFKPVLSKNEDGTYGIEHFPRNDSVELYLNRFSGELCYCMTSIPVKESMKKRDYLLLKRAVLLMLRDYYNGKNPEPIPGVIKDTRGAVGALDEGVLGVDAGAAADGPDGGEEIIVADSDESEQDIKQFALFRSMRGIKGNRVFNALLGLLGKPLRINGSHFIFRGKNGRTYPIPLHGDDQVGLGILKKCLKMWGIAPEEFAARV